MWYFVVFQPFKCRNAHIQHQFGQFDILPQFGHLIRFPNDSESLLYKLKKLRNSEPGGGSGFKLFHFVYWFHNRFCSRSILQHLSFLYLYF